MQHTIGVGTRANCAQASSQTSPELGHEGDNLIHSVLSNQPIVDRTEVAPLPKHAVNLGRPMFHGVVVRLPRVEQLVPTAAFVRVLSTRSASAPGSKRGRTYEFHCRDPQTVNVKARVILIEKVWTLLEVLRAEHMHHPRTHGPIPTVSTDVCVAPFALVRWGGGDPRSGVHCQTKVDKPETDGRRHLLQPRRQAIACDDVADKEVMGVHVTVPSHWSQPVQDGRDLPHKALRHRTAATDGRGPRTSIAADASRRSGSSSYPHVQLFPRKSRHHSANAPALNTRIHFVSNAARKTKQLLLLVRPIQ
mmetsp:Transcript_54535/g.145560  ORF Transcript_54535/g.145560 Transcript_54535/m.145560 type:complete len:306 (+) Transcript_54535:748-1665(+)